MEYEHSAGGIGFFFVLLALSSLGWGFLLNRVTGLGRRFPDLPHLFFFSGAFGVLIEGDLFLLAGVLGLVKPLWFGLIVLVGIAGGAWSIVPLLRNREGKGKTNPKHFSGRILFLTLCVPFILPMFLDGLIPDVSGDAYLYHMTVPNYYVLEGRISPVPISFCYNYPLQIEMFHMAARCFGHEQAGVMMNIGLVLLTCLGLYLVGREMGDFRVGYLSSFFFLSLPLVMSWGPTSLVDLATGTYLAGGLLGLIQWHKTGKTFWLFVCGLCSGGAIAVKILMAAVSLGIFPLILLIFSLKRGGRFHPGRNLVLYFAGVLVTLLPWLVKNAVFTGNPVFPFLLERFPTRPDLLPSAHLLHRMHGIPPVKSAGAVLNRAIRIFPLLTWDGAWVPILSLFLIPVCFIRSLFHRKWRIFWSIEMLTVLFILYYGKNAQVRWFQGLFAIMMPALSLVCLDILKRTPSFRVILTVSGLFFLYLLGARYYQLNLQSSHRLPWFGLREKTVLEYLETQDRTNEAAFIHHHVPEGGKVFVQEMEIMSVGRWMRRRFVQGGQLWINQWEKDKGGEGRDPEVLLDAFEEEEVTHIYATRHQTSRNFQQLLEHYSLKRGFFLGGGIYELELKGRSGQK